MNVAWSVTPVQLTVDPNALEPPDPAGILAAPDPAASPGENQPTAIAGPRRATQQPTPRAPPVSASAKSPTTPRSVTTTSPGVAPPLRPEFFRRHRSAPRQRRTVRRKRHACHTVGISPTCHGTRAAIRISSAPQSTRRVITP